jgi:hypothetical protein
MVGRGNFVPALAVGYTHQSITENAIEQIDKEQFGVTKLNQSMKRAISQIVEANAKTDDDQVISAKHFDGENFTGGQQRLQRLVVSIKTELSTEQGIKDPSKARSALGEALHALQDFYSHSNWVEYYGGINTNLGASGVSLTDPSPTLPTCDDSVTCCTPSVPACPNLIVPVPLLTSGYFGAKKTGYEDKRKLPNKCSHGGFKDITAVGGGVGINKDTTLCLISPHQSYHSDAASRAESATKHFITNVVKPQLTDRQFRALLGYTPQLGVGALMDVSSLVVGTWTVTIGANGNVTLRVYGESDLDLTSFDFVEVHGRPVHHGYGPTNGLPVIGQSSKALARVTNIGFSAAQFEMRTKAGAVLQTLNFSEITNTNPGNVFREMGGNVTTSNVPFLVYMVGTDAGGNAFQRVWSRVIEPKPLQVIAPKALELVPGQTTLFKFKVKVLSIFGADQYSFQAEDSLGYYYSITPTTRILSPGSNDTAEVTVEIRTPISAIPGTVDTIVFTAQGNFVGDNLNYNGVVIEAEVADSADTLPPGLNCLDDITATAPSGQNGAVVSYQSPEVYDNRAGSTVVCSPQSGSMFPVGTTSVDCTATDAAGNVNNCGFSITVTHTGDTEPPVIICPANIVTNIPYGQSSSIIHYPSPAVTDNRTGATFSCSPASGSTFARGTTPVTCTATDTSGNQSSCGFTITIYDVSLQDDALGHTLLFNSITGDYIFYKCGPGGFTLSGRGTITRQGCLVKLGGDPKVSATLDSCPINPANRGSATIKPNPIGGWIYITDSNTTNNTPPCPNG